MPKYKVIVRKRRKAIKSYIKKGFSANKIQKLLKQRHMGIRRKELLKEIRRIKHVRVKRERYKYIPRKYLKRIAERKRRIRIIGRQVAVYGSAHTKRNIRGYSARFEFYGSGKSLYEAVIKAKKGFVPRKEYPFVKCSASDFLSEPLTYGEKGWWSYEEVRS